MRKHYEKKKVLLHLRTSPIIMSTRSELELLRSNVQSNSNIPNISAINEIQKVSNLKSSNIIIYL